MTIPRVIPFAMAALVLAAPAAAQPSDTPASNAAGDQVSEVIVTVSPLAGDPDRFATIVEKVDRESVLSRGGSSLADALRDSPGVAGTGFAAGASRPVIRGMDAQRVKVVENGQSSADVSDVGPDHGIPIDPLAAQTIEVVRGAATLRYGSQAIGGVVNVFNNRIPRHRIGGVEGEATAGYDSVADTREGSVLLDAGSGAAAIHLDAFHRDAGDYDTPIGVQTNSFFRGGGYAAGASVFFGGNSRIGMSATRYNARYGIPAEDSFIAMRQSKGALGSSLKIGAGPLQTLNLDASFADYSHSEIDPAGTAVLSTFNNREWDGRVEALFSQIGPLSGAAAGIQLQDRRFDALGDGADYLLPTHTRNAAGFVFVEAPLAALQFQGAVRVEAVRIDGTPVSGLPTERRFTPVSASAGLTYKLSEDIRLGLTATSAARAPAQTELFARGPHDGPMTFETGDPALKRERANSLEASVRMRFADTGRLEASVWGAAFEDYIFGALTGYLCDDAGVCGQNGPGDLKELNYAQADAEFWGAELKGSAPLAKLGGGSLSANVLADYVRAKFANGGDLPRIQPGRVGGGLGWESETLDASVMVLAVGAQNHAGAGDTPTKGFTTLDAQLAWRPVGRRLELLLVGHNLTDQLERSATALSKDKVTLPGRDIRLVARARF